MTLRQKMLQGALWSTIGKWGDKLISTVIFFTLARLLAVDDFGLVALATVFLTFIETIVEQGFSQAIIQRKEVESAHLDTAFWCGVGISILLTGVIILIANPVSVLFKAPRLTPIIQWLSLSLVFKGLNSVQETILRRELDFKAISIRRIIGNLVGGLVGITMAFGGQGAWSLVGKQLVDVALGVPLLWCVSGWRPRLRFSAEHFRELFTFQMHIIGLRFFNFLSQHSTNLLIGYFLGTVALGYYNIANRLISLILQVVTSATTEVMESTFARLQQEPVQLRRTFYKTTELLSVINIPAFLGLLLLAPELVPMLFGEQWIASAPVIQILALLGIVESTNFINGCMLIAMGRPSWYLKIRGLDFVLSITLFLLAFRFGIVAVATADTIRQYLLLPFMLIAVQKLTQIKMKQYFSHFYAPLLCSVFMGFSMVGSKFLLNSSGLIKAEIVIICGIIGILIYGISVLFISPEYIQVMKKYTLNRMKKTKIN